MLAFNGIRIELSRLRTWELLLASQLTYGAGLYPQKR